MQALKPGFVYFLLVFGTGFVLGTIRVFLIVPLVGHRTAELLEMPLMLIATVLTARWTIRRFSEPRTSAARLSIGGIALGLMLAGELARGRHRTPGHDTGRGLLEPRPGCPDGLLHKPHPLRRHAVDRVTAVSSVLAETGPSPTYDLIQRAGRATARGSFRNVPPHPPRSQKASRRGAIHARESSDDARRAREW